MAESTVIVLESFQGKVKDGEQDRIFREGENIRADDPAVKKWPHFFGPVRYLHDNVEQATAAPGEKRSLLGRKPDAKASEPAGKAISTASLGQKS